MLFRIIKSTFDYLFPERPFSTEWAKEQHVVNLSKEAVQKLNETVLRLNRLYVDLSVSRDASNHLKYCFGFCSSTLMPGYLFDKSQGILFVVKETDVNVLRGATVHWLTVSPGIEGLAVTNPNDPDNIPVIKLPQ